MSAWIHRTGELVGLPDSVGSEFDLCANEAVTNIISYAYGDAQSHRISVRIRATRDRVSLEVEDDGRPFNPLEFPPAAPATSLEQAPLGGRGIHLIRGLMAECRYQRREGKNILTMVPRPHARAGPRTHI
jgi:anti-sigma regulatory factor (Ser/Thr protein kinase)